MSVAAGIIPSPIEDLVVETAISEALLRDTGLVLVSHVAVPRSREHALEHPAAHQTRLDWLEGHAATARERGVKDVEVVVPSSPGDLPAAILEVDQRDDVDLLVIGIPRRSRVGKAIIGSNSQEILLHCDHPVLGVKLPADDHG